MSESNVWGDVEGDSPGDFAADKDGVIDLTQELGEASDYATVVEATDAPVKKRSILPVLIGVALVGLSAAGYVGYGLFQKLFPSDDQARAGGVSLIDTSLRAEAAPSLPGNDHKDRVNSLPISAGASTLPINSNAAEPLDEDLAPFAAVAGDQGATALDPASLLGNSSGPVGEPALAEPVNPSTAGLTAAPALIQPAVVASIAPPVEAAVKPPIAAAKPVAMVVAIKPPSSSVVRVPDNVSKPENALHSKPSVARQKSTNKPAREYTSAGRPKVARGDSVESRSAKDLGRMSNYNVVAIEPKHGSYQQAWIRDGAGKVRIVAKGDVIDGARVTDVQFAKGRVMTDRGEIRK